MSGSINKKVIYTQRALNSIKSITLYIALRGYPETAKYFAHQLFEFGNSLNIFPEKFPLSKITALSSRGLRVAVFRKNYVFIYKIEEQYVVIYNVVHAKTHSHSWI